MFMKEILLKEKAIIFLVFSFHDTIHTKLNEAYKWFFGFLSLCSILTSISTVLKAPSQLPSQKLPERTLWNWYLKPT